MLAAVLWCTVLHWRVGVPCWNKKVAPLQAVLYRYVMSKSAAAAVILGAAAVTVAAQQESTPVFRAGTTLVEFTIVATDQRGEPVTDLSQREITIVQNGKPQPVAFFRFEGSAFGPDAAEAKREPIAPGLFTNRPEYSPGPARNVTAIVIDTLNTLPEDQVAVKAQVMQYLRALAPNTRVAVYALGSNLRILHDFTDDLEALRARLAKQNIELNVQAISADELVRRQLMEAEHFNDAVDEYVDDDSEEEARAEADAKAEFNRVRGHIERAEEYFWEQLHMRRMNQTMASLEALGNHMAGIPGRKNMVWISGGISVLTQGAQDRWVNSYASQVRGLAQRLATQGITVYPVQATGLRVGILGTSTTAPGSSRGQEEKVYLRPMTRENELRIWSTMDMLAEVTGGRAFRNTNELTAGVRAAATDLRGSYSVGFYVPDNSDNRWREFDVRVSRPGVRVLHRKGYMALAPVKEPVNWSQAEWQAAMQNPLGSIAIRLDARADSTANGLNVLIQIAADDLYYKRVNGAPVADLEIGFGERNSKEWTRVRRDGAIITIKENPQQATKASIVRFSKTWTVEPDTTEVRLIVRDRMTARFGVLDMPMADIRR